MSHGLRIEYLPLGALKPYPRNARTHSRKQIRQIANSIEEFGFTNPLIIDRDSMILAGHGRLEAARMLGMAEVPCVRIESMTPAQKRAYVIADNKLALNAGWDEELLGQELRLLLAEDPEFDIDLTGFAIAEVDGLIEGLAVEEPASPRDEVLPPLEEGPPVTRRGDVWRLGSHRLICGDSLSPEVVAALMAGETAQMVFTDPPYNVPIEGHVSGLGKVKHREFAMASGEMTRDQFTDFLARAFRNLADHSADGAIHFVCMDWRHMGEMLEAGEKVYSGLRNLIVWDKGTGGMGSFYRSRHELIFAFKKGTAPHINSFELGQHGRYRTNVWSYRGMNSFGAARSDEIQLHPTVKPVAMVADAIKDVSQRGAIVLDLFGGSGSTLIAAHKTGRRRVTVPMVTAVLRAVAMNAAKGNNRAATLFTTLLSKTEAENRKLAIEAFGAALDYKATWTRELERRKTLNLSLPDPVPHPDDIILDARRMTFRVAGPMTREELPRYWLGAELIEAYREANDELREKAASLPEGPERDKLHRTMAANDKNIAQLTPHYGPRSERVKDPLIREVEDIVGGPLENQDRQED